MNKSLLGQHIHLHFIVILLGFTAILGALISLPAMQLVWHRMYLAFIGLWLYFRWKRIPYQLPWKSRLFLYAIGLVVALHWAAFFHAIKVSNVSVTLGVFASATLFTSLLEPLWQKRRIYWLEVVIGVVVIGGIYLIFQYEFHYLEGILYSLLSALLYGLFVVLNRQISMKHHPAVIGFHEMVGGFACLSLYLLATASFNTALFRISWADVAYLLMLAFLCTSYAFSAIVHIMRKLSAYTVVLAVNLEPLYGILMAQMMFPATERMSAGFYAGAIIIVGSVIAHPLLKRKLKQEKR